MNSKLVKGVVFFGFGIALYVVLGSIINIPLLAGSHIQTDLGYIAFGFYLYRFGPKATIVGVLGCLIESLLTSGWVPVGWMLGQVFIGLTCGTAYVFMNRNANIKFHIIAIIITILSVFIGIGIIKTIVECYLYSIPFEVKIIKNLVAALSDVIPMIIGMELGKRLNGVIDTNAKM